MSVVQAVEEIGPCKRRLRIEVPAPAVEAESSRVAGELAKKVRLPGFRRGKVPPALVRRQFPEEVRRELVERIVPRYWHQAAAERGLDPLGPPRVADVHLHEGEAMTFTAEVEVRPEFELRNYRDFALPAIEIEPAAEEIRGALEALLRGAAEWAEVERPAAVGDRATLELVETTPGAAGEPQRATIEIGSPAVWEELNLAATGLAPGGSSGFVRREAGAEGARERTFELRLVALAEARPPAADDATARRLGKFDSWEALRADVTERLRRARREEGDAERQRLLLDQLTERHPMPLPEGVVAAEVEELLREYAEGLARRGVDPGTSGLDWTKLGEEVRPHAERRVKARLVLDAIAERERIAVSEAEFEQALALFARLEGVASGALRQRLDARGELAALRARMRREKTIRYLLGGAGGSEPPPAG
jgi:trigger factor